MASISEFFSGIYNTYQMIFGNGEDLETRDGFLIYLYGKL